MSKNIVVVGNGFAGSQSAVALRNGMGKRGHKITIISPFDYCEVPMNMGQVLAAGAAEHEKVLFPAMKENGIEYVQDSAKELTPDKVITSNGTEVPFDVCIIATGQCNPVFMPDPNSAKTRESRVAQVSALHEKIVAAKNIVLSGGGPVGSETAADIKLRYPDKTVTVVCAQPTILHSMSPMFHPVAMSAAEKIGVRVVPNDRVVGNNDGKVMLKSGQELPCDLYLPAHPVGGNCAFMPGDCVNERNYAKVNDYFQLENPNFTNVFAIGDCSNFDPVKTAIKVDDQKATLVPNVFAKLDGKPLKVHIRGSSFEGQVTGPLMVALGHGVPGAIGIGPDCPGCCGNCCWFMCCCSPPSGGFIAGQKAAFNYTVKPNKKGLSPA